MNLITLGSERVNIRKLKWVRHTVIRASALTADFNEQANELLTPRPWVRTVRSVHKQTAELKNHYHHPLLRKTREETNWLFFAHRCFYFLEVPKNTHVMMFSTYAAAAQSSMGQGCRKLRTSSSCTRRLSAILYMITSFACFDRNWKKKHIYMGVPYMGNPYMGNPYVGVKPRPNGDDNPCPIYG